MYGFLLFVFSPVIERATSIGKRIGYRSGDGSRDLGSTGGPPRSRIGSGYKAKVVRNTEAHAANSESPCQRKKTPLVVFESNRQLKLDLPGFRVRTSFQILPSLLQSTIPTNIPIKPISIPRRIKAIALGFLLFPPPCSWPPPISLRRCLPLSSA